jgi:RHS repeat-associated protein
VQEGHVVTTTVYDKVGNTINVIDPRNHATTYAYDPANRQTSVQDADGNLSATVYDPAGNVVANIDPQLKETDYFYDPANRRTAVRDPDRFVTTTVYDPVGNVVQTIDGLGHSTLYAYDAVNRQTASQDANSSQEAYQYDRDGNLTTVRDPNSNLTQFAYDNDNLKTLMIDPLNKVATYQYDQDLRLTLSIDRNGRSRAFSYDEDGRLTGELWKNAAGTVVNTLTYTYDGDGNLLTAANNNGAYAYRYDDANRRTAVQEPFGLALTYQLDNDGNATTVQDSFGGLLTATYDNDNLLRARQFGGSTPLRVNLDWTTRNQLATLTYYRDLAGMQPVALTSYQYDPAELLSSIQHQKSDGTPLVSYAYQYDAADRLTRQTINGTPTAYQYDVGDRLTAANSTAYSYDAAGNRIDSGLQPGANNQLTTDGAFAYTYDNEGNLVQKRNPTTGEIITYTYDNANQLLFVLDTAGTTVTEVDYKYDVFGHRIERDKLVNGVVQTVTRYGYDDQGNIWADLDGTNNNRLLTRRFYLDAVDQVFARLDYTNNPTTPVLTYYLTDRQGTVRDLLDAATAQVVDHLDYNAYGLVANETNPAVGDRYKYTGREWDSDTQLQHNGARDYDPRTGRWLSQDPAGFDAGDTNLYRYVHNQPTNATDSSGLDGSEMDASYSLRLQQGLAKVQRLADAYGQLRMARELRDEERDQEVLTSRDELFPVKVYPQEAGGELDRFLLSRVQKSWQEEAAAVVRRSRGPQPRYKDPLSDEAIEKAKQDWERAQRELAIIWLRRPAASLDERRQSYRLEQPDMGGLRGPLSPGETLEALQLAMIFLGRGSRGYPGEMPAGGPRPVPPRGGPIDVTPGTAPPESVFTIEVTPGRPALVPQVGGSRQRFLFPGMEEPVATAPASRVKGSVFEESARQVVVDRGETVIETQRRRGALQEGFDFASFTGEGADAQLYLNESKGYVGTIEPRKFSSFGLGKQRAVGPQDTLSRSLQLAEDAIRNANFDDVTKQTLLNQLRDRQAIVRIIGRQSTRVTEATIQKVEERSGFTVQRELIRVPSHD